MDCKVQHGKTNCSKILTLICSILYSGECRRNPAVIKIPVPQSFPWRPTAGQKAWVLRPTRLEPLTLVCLQLNKANQLARAQFLKLTRDTGNESPQESPFLTLMGLSKWMEHTAIKFRLQNSVPGKRVVSGQKPEKADFFARKINGKLKMI